MLEDKPEAEDSAVSNQRYLIVGLGNPGRKYRSNRHNVGFLLVDRLAQAYQIGMGKVQNKAVIGSGRIAGKAVILAKPQTYMNGSGDSVGPLVNYYKIPLENVLVAYDELDLPLGTLRIREKGGAGGHNGMKSIIQHLGQDFPRMRIGIGRPQGRMQPAAFVLQDFSKDEWAMMTDVLDTAVSAVETFVHADINLAMTRFNRKDSSLDDT